jgi:predicted secreted Zn-dependent protease
VPAVQPTDGRTPPQVTITQNLQTVHFNVYGRTTEEIFAYMEAYGPVVENGERGLGLFSPGTPRPSSQTGSSGGRCYVTTMDIVLTPTITLPRLAEPNASAAIRSRFEGLLKEVEAHEQRHLAIFVEGFLELERRLEEGVLECSAATARYASLLNQQIAAIEQNQEAFHVEDDRRIEAARAPLRARIEMFRRNLDSCEARVDAIEARLASLNVELGQIAAQLDAIEAEAGALAAQFPGLVLPEPQFSRYQALRNEIIRTQAAYNAKVASHNTAVTEHNAAVAECDRILDQLNATITDLNWLQ